MERLRATQQPQHGTDTTTDVRRSHAQPVRRVARSGGSGPLTRAPVGRGGVFADVTSSRIQRSTFAASPDASLDTVGARRERGRLPEEIQAGVERLAGLSLDEVRVHYDSARPAGLGAAAYTQGHDIFVGPGEEQHLAHEAWHVVQQAQGRVKPMAQMKGRRPVNDDSGLEHEADVMGAKAQREQRARSRASGPPTPAAPPRAARPPTTAVIQMVKYIRAKNGRVREVDDDYKKKPNEKWASAEDFVKSTSGGAKAEEAREKLRLELAAAEEARVAAELARAAEAKKQARAQERQRIVAANMPANRQGKQIAFPPVVGRADGREADLAYRGMSVNNVLNMQRGGGPIFTVQNPLGTASTVEHIVDDSEDSPFLSFEAGGLGVSAGKYAAKPVDPATGKPYGVEQKESGFLKQEKSYAVKSRERYPDAKRMGYVGGISPRAGTERFDVSDDRKARAHFKPAGKADQDRREKAVDLAVADKEVLVKPGPRGIVPADVPFVAKVQEVDEAYYKKNLTRQNSRKALGYYKPFEGPAVYSKIQVHSSDQDRFKLGVSKDVRPTEDDSDGEMSDIEDIDLDDY